MIKSMGRAEKLFDAGVMVVLTIVTALILLPMWYVVVTSVTPFEVFAKTNGTLWLNPAKITLEGYRQLLQAGQLPHAFLISVYITVVGTALNLVVTVLMAYPLAQKRFALRTPLLLLVLFTLLFNGGLVPTYLVHVGPNKFASRRPTPCPDTST